MAHQLNEKNEERVRTMLATYGLADFADSYPSSLSGGMRQRAALIQMCIRDRACKDRNVKGEIAARQPRISRKPYDQHRI